LLDGDLTASSRSAAPADEMDNEENDRKDKKKVDERGGHMEDDKRSNPHEEQNERDGKK
jgi:hypothetical protein